jgi:enoyl-CoA hydratase
MSYTNLLLETREGVATVTVNRPDKLNALNDRTMDELDAAFAALGADPAVRGVILTGAGEKAFVAGADIGELATQTPVDGKERSIRGQRVLDRIENLGKPVVAAVNGFALGGGCELAMACHVRLASENAKFGQPEVKLGTSPGYGGTVRLPRLIGRGRATELLLTGGMIDAAEAHRIGLVNRVVPQDHLMAEAVKLAKAMVETGPVAVAACLSMIDRQEHLSLDDALEAETKIFGELAGSADFREGTSAFLQKRKANFTGN